MNAKQREILENHRRKLLEEFGAAVINGDEDGAAGLRVAYDDYIYMVREMYRADGDANA